MTEKSKVALREEKTLAWWQENKIFEKSLAKDAPAGEFVFYDGPPFATGLPHYGHILPGTVKDVIPRYKTMRGFHVPRRWGWDCHGLPIEHLVEQELKLETKKEIEQFGIAEFNQRARESVLRHENEWRKIIPRTGRWVDMAHAYKTMDAGYTESVWWSFKTLHEQNLIYRGFKSMHLCPRCETTLSNFEVSQGYKDITDISVYVKFELGEEPGTFLLAWTTTPWTLPGNAAVAVRSDGKYVKVKKDGQFFIVLKNLAEKVLKDNYEIVAELSGKDLIGKKYQTLFNYYQTVGQVYAADFVSIEEGTGIVHIAPAFGEDDYQLSLREKLSFIQPVTTGGRFKPEVTDFAGELVRPRENHQAADVKIIKYLVAKNLLFAKEKIVHSYPHCWRCETPLLNYAASSWFLKVTAIKSKLLAENQKVKWVPEDIRDGRFGKWLEGARDWAISRSRYWGAPLPVWECPDCKAQKIIGGIAELKSLLPKSGNKYFLMRHGEAESNVKNIFSAGLDNPHHLTEWGKRQVLTAAQELRTAKIDLIVASDLVRTRETAERVGAILGALVIFDQRLRELNFADLDGAPVTTSYHGRAGVESFQAVRRRVNELLYELETSQSGRTILLITHDVPARALIGSAESFSLAEWRPLDFAPLPHNADYELDLHRPYIDAIKFTCACGGEMKRTPEVFDTWYDSGAVPFASSGLRESRPADFIAEGLDQTRGWFYTMLVLATALFGQSPYRRVVVNGLILAEDGRKMSKRLKNYPELADVLDKYGADALRYYLMSSPAVRAEDLAFSEKGLDEVVKKIVLRLENVTAFYQLYQKNAPPPGTVRGGDILDRWILARLAQLRAEVTAGLDSYQLEQAARPLRLFVDDLSTWYLRRSRKRPEALPVLRQVLLDLAKIMAPFMPFIAESIYQKVRNENKTESVHLASWPEAEKFDEKLLADMAQARKIVSLGFEARAGAGIKVRQPLARLIVRSDLKKPYQASVLGELNVKEIVHQPDLASEIKLDIILTPELEQEGKLRDLIRQIQAERKKLKLAPGQLALLMLNPDKKIPAGKNEAELKKTCSLLAINFDSVCPTDSIILKV